MSYNPKLIKRLSVMFQNVVGSWILSVVSINDQNVYNATFANFYRVSIISQAAATEVPLPITGRKNPT